MSDTEQQAMDSLIGLGTDEEEDKNKESKDKDSEDKDSKDKDSEDKDSKDKDSEDEDSKDKDSEDKDKEDEDSKDKDSEDEDKDKDKDKDKDSKDLTLEEVKLLVSGEKDIPEGVDENLVKLARSELRHEALEKENASLKGHLKADPAKLLTEEQLKEIAELASTDFDAAYALRKKYEDEALEKATNNPEVQKIQREEEMRTFLKENKISFAQFRGAVLDSTKQSLANREITFQEFMTKTLETYRRINPDSIKKGDKAPASKKARNSKLAGQEKEPDNKKLAKDLTEC